MTNLIPTAEKVQGSAGEEPPMTPHDTTGVGPPTEVPTQTLARPSPTSTRQYQKGAFATKFPAFVLGLLLGLVCYHFMGPVFRDLIPSPGFEAGFQPKPAVRPGQARTPTEQATDVPKAIIAVMGATGSGKSTFINLLGGSHLGVGEGLESMTEEVQPAEAFDLDGRRVVLVDTPGFDDTMLSDTDVLNKIAAFLATSYEGGAKLSGVLYFHRISDRRMSGIARKNFGLFRKLCGVKALKNVVIVTNMWGDVDPEVGGSREAELMSKDIFFKPALDKGAQMARHENTVSSAQNIIRRILNNHPLPLLIQEELVTDQKDISETSAGEELKREFEAQITKHEQEMRRLREEMQQAINDKDEETRRELENEIRGLRGKIEEVQANGEKMVSGYKTRIGKLRDILREEQREKARLLERIKILEDKSNRDSNFEPGYFEKIWASFAGTR